MQSCLPCAGWQNSGFSGRGVRVKLWFFGAWRDIRRNIGEKV